MLAVGSLPEAPKLSNLNDWQIAVDAGGVPVLAYRSDALRAEISLNGAHMTVFENTRRGRSMFWMDDASSPAGHGIRGGVPIVFPWFGPHGVRRDLPRHGFAHNLLWSVAGEFRSGAAVAGVVLELDDSPVTRAMWPHAFRARLAVAIEEAAVAMRFSVKNTGSAPMTYDDGFHPYFAVGRASDVQVDGTEGVEFLDKVEKFARKRQAGPIRFGGEVDRVFLDTAGACTIREGGRAVLVVEKAGSRETVVWNPGPENGAEAAPPFVCVEPANCFEHPVTLAPGEEHATSVRFAFAE